MSAGEKRHESTPQGSPQGSTQGSPTLTFKGGGWVILLAAVLVLLVMFWSLLGPLLGRHPTGDGRHLESYGYDLSTLLVPRESLVPSGNPRGFLPSLDDPMHLRGAEMQVFNEQNRPKYVVSTDRVLGIVVDGHAHAWPLSMLNAHEVVNDTVSGTPLLVTYSPLCDAAMVFDRMVDGCERFFEVSGLLVDSNLVFVDKSAVGVEPSAHVPSLFLQLEGRAIAGPLAAKSVALALRPGACITTWADWIATHPDSTVTLRDPQMIRRMKEISYARYFLSDGLEYPADPVPTAPQLQAEGLRLKSPMVAFEVDGRWHSVSVEALVARCDAQRRVRFAVGSATAPEDRAAELGAVELEAVVPAGPAVVRLSRVDGQPLPTIPALHFALEAVFGPLHGLDLHRP